MSRFVTCKKDSDEFKKYIWGTFSENERALPIKSLNVGTVSETVTFEIKSLAEVQAPSLWKIYLRLIKWNYFFLIFVPLYYVFVKNYVYQRLFDLNSFYLSIVASLFLFAGLNIRNDINDHLSGFDWIIKSKNKKPVLSGWVTAQKAQFFSWVLIVLAIGFAIPVCLRQHEALRVSVVTLILFLAGNFLNKNNYKFTPISEFILFVMLGPGLCSGYQVALGSGVDTEILIFGTAWGVAVLFLLYIVQFEHLFETSQAKIQNTLTKIGFDKSKIFFKFWWSFFVFLWVVYHYFYSSQYWLWISTIVLIFWSLPTFIQIANVHSPIGSNLSRVRKAGFRMFALMVMILVLEQSWYLYSHWDWVL